MTVPATLSPEQKDTALNDSPTIAPSEINDIDAKASASESDLRHLEDLKVSDDELFGDLTYNQLSLYEKKSCVRNYGLNRKRPSPLTSLFAAAGFWCACSRHSEPSSSLANPIVESQINREFDRMVRNVALALKHVTLVENADPPSPLPRMLSRALEWDDTRWVDCRANTHVASPSDAWS